MIEQEYLIKNKPDSSSNPQLDATIHRIHKVVGNLIHTFNIYDAYVYDSDPWMVILAAASFAVRAIYHRTKKIPGQLVFVRDMILQINYIANWRLIRQRKQAQIDKDVIRNNSTRVDHNYIIG